MRFLAVIAVFLYHSYYLQPFGDTGVSKVAEFLFSKANGIGVSFFFILSGFVLAWSVRANDTPARFWRRRVVKIYPNHVVTWLIALVLAFSVGQALTGAQIFSNLFLVQAWFPSMEIMFSLNEVSWSLACEIFFYLMFPVLFVLAKKIPAARLWLCVGVVIAAIFALIFVATLLPQDGMDTWQGWLLYTLPPARALEFVVGILMARIVIAKRWIPLGLGPAFLLLAAGYGALLLTPSPYHAVAPTIIPLALIIPAAATADLRNLPSFLRGRVFVWLGEISFAFYLVHRLVQMYGEMALGDPEQTWGTAQAIGLLAVSFVISLLLAWLLHITVERPMMKRFASSKKPKPENRPGPDKVGVSG
ncbi:acyltransferase family protein [Amycolatopsis cihanbeyliensis]